MITYKGTDRNMTCRGYQFKLNRVYKEEKAVLCERGFHSCIEPLSVFSHYPPIDGTRYFQCKSSGQIDRHFGIIPDNKIASTEICLKKELSLEDLIEAQFELNKHKYKSKSLFSQKNFASIAPGDGFTVLENHAIVAASGDGTSVATLGYNSTCCITGRLSTAAIMGGGGTIYAKGEKNKVVSYGTVSVIEASGADSTAVALNDTSYVSVSGKRSIAAAFGKNSSVKGELGDLLTLYSYEMDEQKRYVPVAGVTVKVDGVKIKPGVWYCLNQQNEFVEDPNWG